MSKQTCAKRIVVDTLLAEGVRHVFGNPGTTELPLIDALADCPDIVYVLCLQEAAAVSMADAYAHAAGDVGVVNLHVGPGLGNGIGSLYNAWEGGTPLVVTAGQQDTHMRLREPLLSHDLVAMAKPVTKWSVEARTAHELPLLLNRAFKTAREAPSGPVFVSLPMDVMDQPTTATALPPSRIHERAQPDPDGVADAARLLLRAEHPCIVCGDRVAAAGATANLVTLAEQLGAGVWHEVLPARVDFPLGHEQYVDRVPNDHAAMARALAGADVVLLVGGDFFEEVWFAEGAPFARGTKLVHVDPVPANVGRNHRVDCGIVADVGATLRALSIVIKQRASDEFRAAAAARRSALAAAKAVVREAYAERARTDTTPMTVARLMSEVRAALPAEAAVVGEAITGAVDMLHALQFAGPDDYLASRGGGIGQGLPGGVGFKLARPERPVLCVSGDGSALYNVQALWTAAHHRVPVVFMVLNNGAYRILKLNMNRYRGGPGYRASGGSNRGYPHLDLDDPAPGFVDLARGFGIKAGRIEHAAAVRDALTEAFESGEPRLLDVMVDGSLP